MKKIKQSPGDALDMKTKNIKETQACTVGDEAWGHGGTVVTHLPPISEIGGSNPEPYVGKMEVFTNGR